MFKRLGDKEWVVSVLYGCAASALMAGLLAVTSFIGAP